MKLKKGILMFCAALTLLSPFAAVADVTSASLGAGRSDSVFVAGNPAAFPFEFFDEDAKSYRGIVPDLLGIISEQTGIPFTYIAAGAEDRQAELVQNRQVELATAVMGEDAELYSELIPVMSYQSGDEANTVYIAFTDIVSEYDKNNIKTALSQIPIEELNGLMLSYTQADSDTSLHLLLGVIVLSVLLLVGGAALYIVRKKKRKKETLESMVDPHTGVGNDSYYLYAFDGLISEQAKNLYCAAYIAFEWDKAEGLYGRTACEEIEKYAAAHLNTLTASAEYLSRIKDGVFVLLFQSESLERCERRAQEIAESLNRYMEGFNAEWIALFRTGVARLCEHPGCTAETAVFYARQGYVYAESNRLLYGISSKETVSENEKRTKLYQQLSDAFKNREFKIFIQFIVDGKSGKVCGGEVLSRWQNPQLGLLKPQAYLELLKESGKIVEHDYHVFDKVCRQLALWQAPPYDELFLTCNFTRASLSDKDFGENIRRIAEKHPFSRDRLVIEMTEDTLGESSEFISQNLEKVRGLGFRVAIDDMGAGFSSLADIYDNPVDLVKIERDFLSSCNSERRQRMLRDMILLIHNSGAKVICEGVETQAQQKLLEQIECDMMQGFYHCRVLPLSECENYLRIKER